MYYDSGKGLKLDCSIQATMASLIDTNDIKIIVITLQCTTFNNSGHNMLIILIVNKNRSLSIEFDTNIINRQISEVDKTWSHNFLWLSTLIDFNQQRSEIQKTNVWRDLLTNVTEYWKYMWLALTDAVSHLNKARSGKINCLYMGSYFLMSDLNSLYFYRHV